MDVIVKLINIELFDGIIRFNIYLLMLNIFLILCFFASWYLSYRKTGWKVDFYYFSFFMAFIPSVFIMYPFNASKFNIISMGAAYCKVEPFVNLAYLITIVGIIFFILGNILFNTIKTDKLIFPIKAICNPIERMIRYNINNKFGLRFFSIAFLTILLLFLCFQIHSGYLGDPRSFFMKNIEYRPIGNAILSIYPIIFIFLSLRYMQYKNRLDFILLIALFLLSFCLGTRSAIFFPFVTSIAFFIFKNRGKINLIKLFSILFFILCLFMLIGNARVNNFSIFDGFLKKIFYGNNFSDTRDFAWILAYWNFEYVYGKTYLSGIMSFIPSFLSDFRLEWSLSRYTNTFVGFDSSIHPGLRPGKFGEVFLNFGIAGVALFGFIYGYILSYTNFKLKRIIIENGDIIKAYSYTFTFTFIGYFAITAGFFELYIFIFFNILLYIFNYIVNSYRVVKNDIH